MDPALVQQTVDDFWDAFPTYWHSVRAYIRQAVEETGEISVEQFHILRHIRQGRTSASQLAEVKRISRPAISQAVQALAEKGLVARSQDRDDRRRVSLSLTPAGEQLLNIVFDRTNCWMKSNFSELGKQELITIRLALASLKKITQP
jgi:DNA-binding MarR family transcriptional regulator